MFLLLSLIVIYKKYFNIKTNNIKLVFPDRITITELR